MRLPRRVFVRAGGVAHIYIQMQEIYLDHNSTTPVLPEVVAAMRPYWTETFANPASAHRAGSRARKALEAARETVARILHAGADEVIFTSGATEANNVAIFSLCGDPSSTLAVSAVEHPSVAESFEHLEKRGHQVHRLAVDASGVVDVERTRNCFQQATQLRLAAVMLVNNETGAVQPVSRLRDALSAEHFHCDAAQAVGRMPVDFHALGVSTLSLSGHKFNGPKGIGALLVRKGTPIQPLFFGGHQQRGLRPGTEPVALVVGMARALELAHEQMAERKQHVVMLRQLFLDRLVQLASPIVLNGPREGGQPHAVNVSFPGCRGDALLMKLDLAGVACSTGSACSSGSLLPSPVLKAMGVPDPVLKSAIRFSLSHLNTEEEIEEAARRIADATRVRDTEILLPRQPQAANL